MSKNKLELNLESKHLNSLKIKIEYDNKNSFSIYKNKQIQINSSNPFLNEIIPELPDPRIKILEKYIQSNFNNSLVLEKNIEIWLNSIEQKITNSS